MAKHRNLEEIAYRHIRRAILVREVAAGSRLSEPAIAQQLEISRTPVRNALRRLAAEGLVTLSANQGAQVARPNLRQVDETYQLRELLEPPAAALACENVTGEVIEELEGMLVEEKEAFDARDLWRYMEVNDAFHLRIADLSGNSVLKRAVETHISMSNVFLSLLDPFYSISEKEMHSFPEHRMLVDYLAVRDPERGRAAMLIHVRASRACIRLEDRLPR